jgi:predicted Zn-dependent protease
MVTCRLLVELTQFKDAVKVLDTVVEENDEMPEAWYLLAFAYFNLKKYLNAKECCRNVKT